MSPIDRVHEWLADRISWVQYPNVQVTEGTRSPFWAYEMPWYQRMGLVVMGMVLLGVCAIALFFLGVLFWAAVTA